ncbi:FUSC family protein [uncultured Sphaerochaeta sp.]|uniref:FUSC family protein n=1 Tax=uncultured Sphaerochaeta sp. TaxID=886478 RepID=UPI0029CA1849|nr:FUSC family protein [uncultured Sphaerochaeta sp.]
MKDRPISPVMVLYISKCLLGTIICYGFYKAFPQYYLHWSIISLLLVLAPDRDNSIALPIARIKANITGALVGLFCFMLPFHQLLGLLIGVVATISICSLLRFPSATRSALAALVIVLLQEGGNPMWSYALQRIFAVLLGCLVGLALTVCFQACEQTYLRKQKVPLQKTKGTE